jgi:hypothetical protein
MADLKRRLFNVLVAMSTALFAATATLWVPSYIAPSPINGPPPPGRVRLASVRGRLEWLQWPPSGTSIVGPTFVSNPDPRSAWESRFPGHVFGIGNVFSICHGPIFTFDINSTPTIVGNGLSGFLSYWAALLVFSVLPCWWLVAWQRHRRRELILAGRCLRCGYDLRATPQRCPECGLLVKPTA